MHDVSRAPFDEATTASAVCLPLCNTSELTDISGDFSLPDYQPEIKRLLRITASPLPPTRYMREDQVSLTGTINYFALYIGPDDELHCAPLSAEYNISIPCHAEPFTESFDPSQCTILCHVATETVQGRVSAPRRLHIKTRLCAHVCAYASFLPDRSIPNGESIERLTEHLSVASPSVTLSEPILLQDDIILPPSEHYELRVICAEGEVMITEAVTASGSINCRGEINVKLMLSPIANSTLNDAPAENPSENMPTTIPLPTVICRKIPFTQRIDIPEVTSLHAACAFGQCADLSIEIEEGHLHLEAGVILEIITEERVTLNYTKDLFSPHRETQCRQADIPITQAIRCLNGNFTLSDSLPLSETDISTDAKILDVSATAEGKDLTIDDRRCILNGICHCHLLLHQNGEYTPSDIDLPFRYETDIRSADPLPENATPLFNGQLSVPICRARMDGERIGIDAEVAVALRLAAHHHARVLTSVSFGDTIPRRSDEYVICFPSPSDTLWSVAKRYHVPLAPLAAANNLTAEDTPPHVLSYLIV